MRRWLIWAGIGLIIGGVTSLAMTLGVQGELHPLEDLSSYSISWIIVGIVVLILGFVLKTKSKHIE